MKTPHTEEGLTRYDHLLTSEAVYLAWNETGPNPEWHEMAKEAVREVMPLLARALDRNKKH